MIDLNLSHNEWQIAVGLVDLERMTVSAAILSVMNNNYASS